MSISNRIFISSSHNGSYVLTSDNKRYYGVAKDAYPFNGSLFVPDNFVWLNYHIYEPITGSENIIGFPLDINWYNFSNTAYNKLFCGGGNIGGTTPNFKYFNTIMNKRNGPYQYPMWKQIRNHDNPLIKWQRENNIIAINEPPQPIVAVNSFNNTTYSFIPLRSNKVTQYVEPAVVSKYHPVVQELGKGKYLDTSLFLKYSFSNNISYFSNNKLNQNCFDVKNSRMGIGRQEDTIYDRIKNLYFGETEENRVIDNVETIIYKETVWPKEENTYLFDTRNRKYFTVYSWNSCRENRERTSVTNSQGFLVEKQSIWPLDSRNNYGVSGYPSLTSSLNGGGELFNKYTTFFGQDKYIVEPDVLGNTITKAAWFNVSPTRIESIPIAAVVNAATNPDTPDTVQFPTCQSVMTCSANWDTLIGEAIIGEASSRNSFSISAWIYIPNTYRNHVDRIPDKQTIVEFGKGNRGLYIVTGAAFGGFDGSYAKNDVDRESSSYLFKNGRKLCFSASYDVAGGEWVTKGDTVLGENVDCLTVDQWHHVGVVFDKSQAVADRVTFYIDGTNWSTAVPSGRGHIDPDDYICGSIDAISPEMVYFGSSSQNHTTHFPIADCVYQDMPYFGFMSDVAVFNNDLSASDFTWIYNNGYPRSLYDFSKTQYLVSWWRMGDGMGAYTGSIIQTNTKDNYVPATEYAYYSYYNEFNYRFKDRINTDVDVDDDYYLKKYCRVLINGNHHNIMNTVFDMVGDKHLVASQSLIANSNVELGKLYFSDFSELNNNIYGHADKDRTVLSNWGDDFKVGAMFSRPELVYTGSNPWFTKSVNLLRTVESVAVTSGRKYVRFKDTRLAINDVKWNILDDVGKKPFYNKYEEYNENIKCLGKDYSLIPEFRMSEHIDWYLDTAKGDFYKEKSDIITLTGSSYKDSSVDNFYKIYSHSDFLKHFEIINEDYKNELEQNTVKLNCKAITKFIPYKGFYPVERTLQLAELFSQSYGDYVKPVGYFTNNKAEATSSWRSFITPFFAPGILYNSIKAGMAVDFPIYGKAPRILEDWKSLNAGGLDYLPLAAETDFATMMVTSSHFVGIYGFPYDATSSMWIASSSKGQYSDDNYYWSSDLRYLSHSATPPSGLGVDGCELDKSIEWYNVFVDDFTKRLPFETLIEPENHASKMHIFDMNPEFSASLRKRFSYDDTNQASYWSGNGKIQYKLAMHNFLSEVPSFFLKDSKMTNFSSKPLSSKGIVIKEDEKNCYFGMDVSISNCDCKNYTEWRDKIKYSLDAEGNVLRPLYSAELDNIKGVHTKMYHRDSAFGPPWVHPSDVFTSSFNMFSFHFGYEPFTPAYFNGFGVARMLFYPFKGSGTYTIDEIQQNMKVFYIRTPSNREGKGALYKYDKMLEYQTALSLDLENIIEETYNKPLKDDINKETGNIEYYLEDVASRRYEFYSTNYVAKKILEATNNWQQLSSSVNLFGKTKVKKVTYEKGSISEYEPVYFEDDEQNAKDVWVIQPKWETPIFNFVNKTPYSSSYGYENLYFTGGIWTQYGDFCSDNKGIYFSVSDLPNRKNTTYKIDLENGNMEFFNNYKTYDLVKLKEAEWENRSKKYTSRYKRYENDYPLGGAFWNDSENIKKDKKENAYVIIYIGNYTRYPNDIFYCTFSCPEREFYHTFGSDAGSAGTSNLGVAKNIADDFANYYTDVKTKVYIPETIPWKNTSSVNDPIAAIKVQIDNKTDLYPYHMAAGSMGNRMIMDFDNWANSVPEAFLVEGADSNGDDKVSNREIYFKSGTSKQYEIKSLADLLGFPKVSKKLGEVEEEKEIKEAIVAIPFIEDSLNGGSKSFFSISRREIELASGKRKLLENEKMPGSSIVGMVQKMKDYVFPPKFDFLNNDFIDPFVMYIFEFKHKLSKEDMRAIWQNVEPEIATSFKTDEVSIEHPLLSNEFFNGKLSDKIRWMIFKVKQKAEINYYKITADQSDDDRFKFDFEVGGKKSSVIPQYSYNWPYDFFSLVELAKLEAQVEFKKK